MKANIKIKIEQISSKTVPLNESEVVHLMVLLRKYLEHAENNDFFVLKFFCDWSLHTAIDRSLPAMELLKKINSIINELKNTPNNDLIMNKITEIVSFQKLKAELKKFFEHTKIANTLISDENIWNSFVEAYIEVILDCPLILADLKRNKKSKQIYEEIVANPIKEGAHVVGFTLSYVNNSLFTGTKEPSLNNTLSLVLFTSDTTRLIIPLSKKFLS
jgi:hypothetical protein